MDFEQMGTMIGARAAIAEVKANARDVVSQQDDEIARLRSTLAIEQAHAAGLKASLDAAKVELAKVQSPLVGRTGRVYGDGTHETRISQIYAKAFDAFAHAKGILNPERFRATVR